MSGVSKSIWIRPCKYFHSGSSNTYKALFHKFTENGLAFVEDYNGKVHIIHGSFITFTEDEFYEIKEWKLTNLTTKEF